MADELSNYTCNAHGLIPINLALLTQEQTPLDAFAEVGMFRLREGEALLEFANITDVAIGTFDTNIVGVTFEDWLTLYPDVDVVFDWYDIVAADIFEDWGDAPVSVADFNASISSTVDGYNQISEIDSTLYEVSNYNKTIRYSADATGVYFTVRLDASSVGQNFQLKILEIQGFSAGRLS